MIQFKQLYRPTLMLRVYRTSQYYSSEKIPNSFVTRLAPYEYLCDIASCPNGCVISTNEMEETQSGVRE